MQTECCESVGLRIEGAFTLKSGDNLAILFLNREWKN